jgi:hypothetical protein
MVKDTSLTSYGAILQFWKGAKKAGWYLPPAAVVKKEAYPFLDSPYVDPIKVQNKISVIRGWLYLTKTKGSELELCDPYTEYTEKFSVCSQMLHAITGAKHMHLDNVIFLLSNGFSESSIMDKLQERYGYGASLIDPGPHYDSVKEILTECMHLCTGEYVFPVKGTPYATLTRYEGAIQFGRYEPHEYVDGLGIALGVPTQLAYEEIVPCLLSAASEVSHALQEVREHRIIREAQTGGVIREETSRNTIDPNLQYAIDQIHGYCAQVQLGLGNVEESRRNAAMLSMEGHAEDFDMDLGGFIGDDDVDY